MEHANSLLHQLYLAYEQFKKSKAKAENDTSRSPLFLKKGGFAEFYQDRVRDTPQNNVDLANMLLQLVTRVLFLLRAWYVHASKKTDEGKQHMPTSLFFLLSVTESILDPKNSGKAPHKSAVHDGEKGLMNDAEMNEGMLHMLAGIVKGNALNADIAQFESALADLLEAMGETVWRQVLATRVSGKKVAGETSGGAVRLPQFYADFRTHIATLSGLRKRLLELLKRLEAFVPNPPSQRPQNPPGGNPDGNDDDASGGGGGPGSSLRDPIVV